MSEIDDVRREQSESKSDWPHPRGNVPMLVEIDNARQSASEWTVSGFTLDKPLPGMDSGEVRNARIALRITDIEISFDLPCQVTRATEMGAVDFKFLGAFTEQAALLYRITEDHLAGQATQLDNLLRSSPVRPFGRNRRKLLLPMLVSLLGVSIASLATVMLVSLLTVRSSIGVVSVGGIALRAPATGVIAQDLLPPGSAVRTACGSMT